MELVSKHNIDWARNAVREKIWDLIGEDVIRRIRDGTDNPAVRLEAEGQVWWQICEKQWQDRVANMREAVAG